MKITHEMIHYAYKVSKLVYEGKVARTEGKYKIAEKTGMSVGSASDYISDFLAMMEGLKYTRTLNRYATKYTLESIEKDYGKIQLNKALEATRQHVQYYNNLKNGNLNSIQKIIDELS